MSEPFLRVEDPSRRPKPAIPPRARKLASLSQPATRPAKEVEPARKAAPVTAAAPAAITAPVAPAASPVVEKAQAPQPAPKPAAKPRSEGSSGNSFVQAVVISLAGLALAGYAFNFGNLKTLSDTYVARLNLNAQTQGTAMAPALAKFLPYLMLIPALLLVYVFLTMLTSMLGLRRKSSKKRSSRGPREDFRESAESRGVGPRIAYQTFLLLEPLLPTGHTLDVGDHLVEDLGLTDPQIRSIRQQLLENTHRQFDPKAPLTRVNTVLGMMISSQQAPALVREKQEEVFIPGDPSRKRA